MSFKRTSSCSPIDRSDSTISSNSNLFQNQTNMSDRCSSVTNETRCCFEDVSDTCHIAHPTDDEFCETLLSSTPLTLIARQVQPPPYLNISTTSNNSSNALAPNSPRFSLSSAVQEPELVPRDGVMRVGSRHDRVVDGRELQVRMTYGEISNFDLRSERSSNNGTAAASSNEVSFCSDHSDTSLSDLRKSCETKDLELSKMTKKYGEIVENQKKFILRNCELQDENDELKYELETIKTTLREAIKENCKLKIRNDELRNTSIVKKCEKCGNSVHLSTISDGIVSKKHLRLLSNPEVKTDLVEALSVCREQQTELWKLQQKILHQNEGVKRLMNVFSRTQQKPIITDERYRDRNVLIVRGEDAKASASSSSLNRQPPSNRLPEPKTVIKTDVEFQLHQPTDDDDIGQDDDIIFKEVNEEDIYTRGESTCVNNRTKDVQNLLQRSQILTRSSDRILVGRSNLLPSSQSANFAAENISALRSDVIACPLCGVKFTSTQWNFKVSFEEHIEECLAKDQRLECPVCFEKFQNTVSQTDFERHVNLHFANEPLRTRDFEELNP